MVRAREIIPTCSFLLMSLNSDAAGLPRINSPTSPHPRAREATAGRCRTLFDASQSDRRARCSDRLTCISYLPGLDAAWEDRLPVWTLGVQNALVEGDALLLSPLELAAPPGGTDFVLRSAPTARERPGQGSAASGDTDR